ncbi:MULTISPECIES: Coq4 family protein [unclassified Sphingopyxis]|uniref:Coq4 family protein n=1 Tax=unclassified Sphingopyxis TaxID=2614943 RepID=UPI0025F7349E|nr:MULTISPECIES: Coq4 family protein [unclassified Sphingopyxis]
MTPTIFSHPDRKMPTFRPFKALSHFRKLIKDKEDTEQVFHIFESLPRKGFMDDARAFVESDKGRQLMASEPYLPDLLDDHAWIDELPEGSVGHAYVTFMRREGLSAAGLVAEADKMGRPKFDDQVQWYANRLRDTHDLFHILTGYGRDALGEQCVLGFTYGQTGNYGNFFIAYAGGYEVKRGVKAKAPVFGAIRQGQRHGKAAKAIIEQDIRALLAEPLDAARARLGIGEPTLYHEAHRAYRSRGIDPYNFLASQQAVAA